MSLNLQAISIIPENTRKPLVSEILWKTCVLVNNNLCGKLFSSVESPKTFDESFKVTSVVFSILEYFHNTFTVHCVNLKWFLLLLP